MICPICNLISPDSAIRCDCGHEFTKDDDGALRKIAFTNSHEYQPIAGKIAREELSARESEVNADAADSAGTWPLTLTKTPAYKGVRGWLLLLCLGLTVFGPLMTLRSLPRAYVESSKYFDLYPGLLVVAVTDPVLSAGLTIFSIYAGIGLWNIRPGAVRTARQYLLCFPGYSIVAVILPFTAGLPSESIDAMIGPATLEIFSRVIYFAIWYSYLGHSKRVKSTYELSTL
jgi:hypothetical protein